LYFILKLRNRTKINLKQIKKGAVKKKQGKLSKLWIILKRCKSLKRAGTKNRRMKFTMKEMNSLDLRVLLSKIQEKLKEEKAIKCLWKI